MRPITVAIFLAAGLLAAAAWERPLHAQQHSYTTQDVEQGRMLYDANCGRCHNNTGDGVTGVELFKQIRRASSDEDIAKIIQNGIPGTGMPPHQFSDQQALSVVAFIRVMAGATATGRGGAAAAATLPPELAGGDAARGKAIFDGKGQCLTCHSVKGAGGTSGPDLTAIARPAGGRGFGALAPSAAQMEQSILEPNAEIRPAYRVYQVTTKSGDMVRGTLLNQDTFSVQLRDSANRLRSFQKTDLRSFGFLDSPMPSYRGMLSDQELKDLVTYLFSLKG